jgi:hypothetical protein
VVDGSDKDGFWTDVRVALDIVLNMFIVMIGIQLGDLAVWPKERRITGMARGVE